MLRKFFILACLLVISGVAVLSLKETGDIQGRLEIKKSTETKNENYSQKIQHLPKTLELLKLKSFEPEKYDSKLSKELSEIADQMLSSLESPKMLNKLSLQLHESVMPKLSKIDSEDKLGIQKIAWHWMPILPEYREDPFDVAVGLTPTPNIDEPQQYNVVFCYTQWDEYVSENWVRDHNAMMSAFAELKSFYARTTDNNTRLNLVNIVPVELYGLEPEYELENSALATEACDPFVDFNTVDHVIIYPSFNVTRGFSGVPAMTEEGPKLLDYTYIGNFHYRDGGSPYYNFLGDGFEDNSTFYHEFGHAAFGFGHASGYECGELVYTDNPQGCETVVYANRLDIMGAYYDKNTVSNVGGWSQFTAKNKSEPWVKHQAVIEDGSYLLGALESQSNEAKVLRIAFNENPICLEYRQVLRSGEVENGGGVYVEVCPGKQRYLLDMTPSSVNGSHSYDFLDGYLREGEVFESQELGIRLQWEEFDNSTAMLDIELLNDVEIARSANIEHYMRESHVSCDENERLFIPVITNQSEFVIENEEDALEVVLLGFLPGENQAIEIDSFSVDELMPGEMFGGRAYDLGQLGAYERFQLVVNGVGGRLYNSLDEFWMLGRGTFCN